MQVAQQQRESDSITIRFPSGFTSSRERCDSIITTHSPCLSLSSGIALNKPAESVYAGPGAGRYPTANSVVNDIVRLARLGAAGTPPPFPLERPLELEPDFEACFYVRVTAADGRGVLSAVGAIASEAGVSVHSVLRGEGGEEAGVVSFVVKTDSCLRSQVAAFVDGLKGKKVATADPVVMSIL